MRRKIGAIFIALGAVLVSAALALFIYNRIEDRAAGETADAVLNELEELIGTVGDDDPYDTGMETVTVDDHDYIGYLTIPSLGLTLPVMSDWDYKNLKIAPCRYSGSVKTGNLVICAHNYSTHFGNIKTLSAGDEVYFTEMDGTVHIYTVAEVYILEPTAVEEMVESGYDLTLYTCTYGGQTRVTVRCSEI